MSKRRIIEKDTRTAPTPPNGSPRPKPPGVEKTQMKNVTGIWDEKPELSDEKYDYEGKKWVRKTKLFMQDRNAWLEKLKTRWDLYQNIKGIDLVGYFDIDGTTLRVIEISRAIDLEEKAEKWDEFCKCLNWLNDPPVESLLRQFHALNIGNQDKRKKLRDINGVWAKYDEILRDYRKIDPKGQSDYHRGHAEVTSELRKILEGEPQPPKESEKK